MQDVTRSYRLLSNLERDELLESGHEEYSKLYREISEKYLDQNILVPQHLNPFASEQKQRVHKKLWEQALNERKTSKQNVALDKEFSQFRSRKTKEIRSKLREKYEFHPDLTFKYSAYNLFLADLRKSRKNESFRELMPKTKNWREINDSVVVANFDRQSKRLREKYDAQNKAGALLALRNEEWLALKSSEVKLYGNKSQKKAFREAERVFSEELLDEFSRKMNISENFDIEDSISRKIGLQIKTNKQ